MPRYGGVTVIDAPPTPFQALAQGLGSGLNTGIARALKEADQRRSMTQEVLMATMNGELDPRLLATPEGQAFLRASGLDKSPEIRAAAMRGEGAALPLNSTPAALPSKAAPTLPAAVNIPRPGPVPLNVVQGQRAKEALDRRMAQADVERDIKIEDARATAAATNEERNRGRTTLADFTKVAAGLGWEKIKDVKVDDQGYVSFGLITPDDIAKRRAEEAKTQGTLADRYYAKKTEGEQARLTAVSSLARVLAPNATPQEQAASTILAAQAMNLGGPQFAGLMNVATASSLTPEQKASAMLVSINRMIDARNVQNRDLARRSGVKHTDAEDIPHLTLGEITGKPATTEDGTNLEWFGRTLTKIFKGFGKAAPPKDAEPGEEPIPARSTPLKEGVPNKPEAASAAAKAKERLDTAAESILEDYQAMRSEGKQVTWADFVDALENDGRKLFSEKFGLSEPEYQHILAWAKEQKLEQ